MTCWYTLSISVPSRSKRKAVLLRVMRVALRQLER
jgi:hypothetical protein